MGLNCHLPVSLSLWPILLIDHMAPVTVAPLPPAHMVFVSLLPPWLWGLLASGLG